jgi:hypothetical protein
VILTWSSVLTREYLIQKTTNLAAQIWLDSGAGIIVPTSTSTTHSLSDSSVISNRFYRIEALRPLAP